MIRALGELRGMRLTSILLAASLAATPVIAEAQDNPAAPPAPARSPPKQRCAGARGGHEFQPGRAREAARADRALSR